GAPAWPTAAAAPALALAAWLVLLPGTWAWAGAHGLSRYDQGAVVAAVGGMAAVVVGRTTRLGWRLTARDRDAVGVRGEGGEGAAEVGARAMVTSSSAADGDPS
ncbi:MAG TPA: hypothetical protein VHE80_04175, partial [Acidimicrobiales bacterium]|nr:hypothetical protein [Acidimicrobiales bacterium]